MATKIKVFLHLLILIAFVVLVARGQNDDDDGGSDADLDLDASHFNRYNFSKGFIFGTSSSAYQMEGAWNLDCKGQSMWDNFTHADNGSRIADGSNGDIAEEQYDLYGGDVPIMKNLNLDAYRLSISWPRVLPNGTEARGVCEDGVQHYRVLFQLLLDNGITPFVTIFHWDVPQPLQDEYGGFLSHKIVNDFRDYADFCFRKFGHLVKNWITLNEPYTFSVLGYALGISAPGRCTPTTKNESSTDLVRPGRGFNASPSCKAGNSGTEPYNVTHHLLLSHAAAVEVYNKTYKNGTGQIGIVLYTEWFVPNNNTSDKDTEAAERSLAFMYGWFMDPLTKGRYPEVMRKHVGRRLPHFNKSESDAVKGSYDFIGVNYYTGTFSADIPCSIGLKPSYLTESCVNISKVNISNIPIGNKTAADNFYIFPEGFAKILNFTKHNYSNPKIYVTENGVATAKNYTKPDYIRIRFIREHLKAMLSVISENGVNVKGYFVWSFMDDFEWASGYTLRFGLIYVDFKTLVRTLKKSAEWFKNFLKPRLF